MTNVQQITMNFLSEEINDKLYRIETIADGSCFFHAILHAMYDDYKNSNVKDKGFIARRFREQLSTTLNTYKEEDMTWYDYLCNGKLSEFSKSVVECSLENMENELDSTSSVSNIYNEYISELIDTNIFIVDVDRQTLYLTGDDPDLLHKERFSIIVAYVEKAKHYETVGYLEDDDYYLTLFPWKHEVIEGIMKFFQNLT